VNRTRIKIGKVLVVDQFTATTVTSSLTALKLNSKNHMEEDKEVLAKTLLAMTGVTASSKRSDMTKIRMLS